jgi:hypothetical protein
MHEVQRFIDGSFHDAVTGEDVCYVMTLEGATDVTAITIDFASEAGEWRSPRESLADACPLPFVRSIACEIAMTAFRRLRAPSRGPTQR